MLIFSVFIIYSEFHRIFDKYANCFWIANFCQMPSKKYIRIEKQTFILKVAIDDIMTYDQNQINRNTLKLVMVVLIAIFRYNRTIPADVLENTLLFIFGWVYVLKQYGWKIRFNNINATIMLHSIQLWLIILCHGISHALRFKNVQHQLR